MNEVNIKEPAKVQLTSGQQAKPQYNHQDYTLLTIKNPSGNCFKDDLCRVYYHLRDIVGFSQSLAEWYETGKQNQPHIHAIIKKRWSYVDIPKISKVYKQKKLKWFEYGIPQFDHELGTVIEESLDTSKYTIHLKEIEDASHLVRLINVYQWKEISPEFID